MLKCIFCYLAGFSFLFVSCFAFAKPPCDSYSIFFYDRNDLVWLDDATFHGKSGETVSNISCNCIDFNRDKVLSALSSESGFFEGKVCKTNQKFSDMTAERAMQDCASICQPLHPALIH